MKDENIIKAIRNLASGFNNIVDANTKSLKAVVEALEDIDETHNNISLKLKRINDRLNAIESKIDSLMPDKSGAKDVRDDDEANFEKMLDDIQKALTDNAKKNISKSKPKPSKSKLIREAVDDAIGLHSCTEDEAADFFARNIGVDDFKMVFGRMPNNDAEIEDFKNINRKICKIAVAKNGKSDKQRDAEISDALDEFYCANVLSDDDRETLSRLSNKEVDEMLDSFNEFYNDNAAKHFKKLFGRKPKNEEELNEFKNINSIVAKNILSGDRNGAEDKKLMNAFIDKYILPDAFSEDEDIDDDIVDIAHKFGEDVSRFLKGEGKDDDNDDDNEDEPGHIVKKIYATKCGVPKEMIERMVDEDTAFTRTLKDGSTVKGVVIDSPEKFNNMMKFIKAAAGSEGVDEVLDTLTQAGYFDDKDNEEKHTGIEADAYEVNDGDGDVDSGDNSDNTQED